MSIPVTSTPRRGERAFTVAEVLRVLRDEVDDAGGVAAWCEEHKIEQAAEVERLLAGAIRAPTPPVLTALGFVPIVRYRRVIR